MSFEGILGVTYLFGSIFVVAGVLPIAALLGLVLSPVAGAISWWLARRRGLHGKRFAVAGAVYSALFLGPWLYFAIRLLGKTPPRLMIGFIYATLYFVWTMPIFDVAFFDNLARDDRYLSEVIWYGRITWVAGLGLLLASLLVLTISEKSEFLKGDGVLLGPGYILPFAGLWASTVGVVVYLWGFPPFLSYLQALGRSFGWW